MPCWQSWCDSHSGHPGQVPTKTVSSKSPVTLRASVRRCQIAGALQTWRTPGTYRLLAVPQPSPQGGVPFPHAAPRCAWRSPSNTSAVVSTCPSLRSHHTGDRQREFRVLPSFNRQLFAASPAGSLSGVPPDASAAVFLASRKIDSAIPFFNAFVPSQGHYNSRPILWPSQLASIQRPAGWAEGTLRNRCSTAARPLSTAMVHCFRPSTVLYLTHTGLHRAANQPTLCKRFARTE